MSNYYEYQDVKVMIAHRLMKMDGWKVYGYTPDQSDMMSDYWNPAHWGGVAEKNGYVLCVDVYCAKDREEIREYNKGALVQDKNVIDKIQKLEQMTMERGASEQEEQTAKNMIQKLQEKNKEIAENNQKYVVTGYIPAHQAHPPKCNWHIEKDGIIIAKGNGLLKFTHLQYKSDFKKQTEQEIREEITRRNQGASWFNEVELEKSVKYQLEEQATTENLLNQFNNFINTIDTTCGCLVGEGEIAQYEIVKKTEYKKENKAFECEGSIKDGQHFIVKSHGFNYNVCNGYVYVIHSHEGTNNKPYFTARRLDGKLKKELTGSANPANNWGLISTSNDGKFMEWIEKGALAFCEIKEVKTPYEVEKVVKKIVKATKAKSETPTEVKKDKKVKEFAKEVLHNQYTYDIKEDVDTRDDSKIYVVKVVDKLDKDEYIEVSKQMKSKGGYYSRFKHGFIFKEEPTELYQEEKQISM